MHDLQSTPLVESSPDAATQSSGESRAARRLKLRQAHLERLRSDNLVLLGAADDSSGSLRREPLSEGTVNAMQGDASVGPTITWTLPSSGVPKFNPELRSVWGEYAVALSRRFSHPRHIQHLRRNGKQRQRKARYCFFN
ncbi:unnamed protein product [Polarella glacialis]|uniref:Uncharacterized protein n=1 Tax=Polarella glacialis TaxID=89957 RepID=A0A813EV56_POLGL|nr:unnamed protein product [Polarella glacialis]